VSVFTGKGSNAVGDRGRMAIGIWMQDGDSPVRVFVTYEALSALDPSQVRSRFTINPARMKMATMKASPF
jgi:hypothetical protein